MQDQNDKSTDQLPNFKEFNHNQSEIVDLGLNNNGNLLAAVDKKGIIKVWDTKEELIIAEFNDNSIFYEKRYLNKAHFSFSEDSKFLAFGFGIGIVKIYDLESKEIKFSHNFFTDLNYEDWNTGAYEADYTYTIFSKTDKYVAIIPTVAAIDPQAEEGLYTEGHISELNPVYFRKFFILDFENNKLIFEYIFDERKIGSVQFSDDEKFVAVGVFGREVKVWELESFKEVYSDNDFVWISNSGEIGMRDCIVFLNNNTIAYATIKMLIKIVSGRSGSWNVEQMLMHSSCRGMITALAYDVDNKVLFSADETDTDQRPWHQHTLIKWNINFLSILKTKIVKCAFVRKIAINYKCNKIILGYTPTIEIRDLTDFNLVETYDPYVWLQSEYMIRNPAVISKNGNALAIALDNIVRYADDSCF